MTKAEAEAIAKIAITADDECFICAANLIKQLADTFPDFAGTFHRAYYQRWPGRMSL